MKNVFFITALLSVSSMGFAVNFSDIDADNNGAISIEEAAGNEVLKDSFGKLDTDANGELSVEEVARINTES